MSESALVQRFRAIAKVEGKDTFEILHGGVRIRVSYVGGSSSRLSMSVPYDEVAHAVPAGYRSGTLAAIRPMKIQLGPEGSTHRSGKASGMDVEVQTGDPAFDDAVYVDTLTPPEVVVQVLGAELRRAALELIAIDFRSIGIDDASGNILATLFSFPSREPEVDIAMLAVDAFARLARGVPQIARIPGQHAAHPLSTWNVLLAVSAVLALVGCPIAYFSQNPRCVDDGTFPQMVDCLWPGLAALVPGVLAAILAASLATRLSRRYAGRSDSSSVASTFAMVLFFLTLLVVTAAIGLLLGKL